MKRILAKKRKLYVFGAFCLLIFLGSCLKPVAGDFPNEGEGLSDDELLWVLRVPATPADGDLGPISTEDSTRFMQYNEPFFKSALQVLCKKVLNGEIPAFEEYPPKTPVKNPRERLLQFGGNGQNIDPLLHVTELYYVLNTKLDVYKSRPVYMRLIWTNPDGREADRGFAGLDLTGVWINEPLAGDQNIKDFVTEENFFSLPVYLRTNFREYAIRSADEARYISKMVRDGKWKHIDWAADGINTSMKKKIDLNPETVSTLAGLYEFPNFEDEENGSSQELYLTAEGDNLIADWNNRFQIERIMPFAPFEFFNNSGELYEFFIDDNEQLYLRVIQKKDTIWGYRINDEE